jgi:formate dehydrogenase iron-sulfur subunit
VLIMAGGLKLGCEAMFYRHLRSQELTGLKQSALLMIGELAEITTARFLLGAIGAVLLPIGFLIQRPAPGIATLGVTTGIMAFTLLGELLERHLFFTAVVSTRMPGGFDA